MDCHREPPEPRALSSNAAPAAYICANTVMDCHREPPEPRALS
jgi:hypothetical protein